MRHALVSLALAFPIVAASPLTAAAGPVTAGINLGLTQSKLDGQSGADANHTLGLFGRIGFNQRLSGQLELTRIETDNTDVDIRTGTALLVIDLGSRGKLVPTLSAGIGLDSATTSYGGSTDAHHIEGGLGLEYRADGGLTLGVDLRMGGRTIDSSGDQLQPVYDATIGPVALYAPSTLREGEYRSARLTLGIRF